MAKNQGKSCCETCDHDEKTGVMYPCAACRSSDKWKAKKAREDDKWKAKKAREDDTLIMTVSMAEGMIKTNELLEDLPFKDATEGVVHRFGHPAELKLPPWITGETDPRGTDAHAPGAKLDAGKVLAGVLADFSLALLAVAEVGTHGAEKYSRGGWQSVPDGETRYKDADWWHLLKGRHEDKDTDSGLLHDAHRAWNVLATLELRLRREKGE